MGIARPIAVYTAANNIEAEQLCIMLSENGVEAYPTRDESVVGYWAFGKLPQIHKPQVWVDERQAEAVRVLLAEYECEQQRRQATRASAADGTIDVVCEECGKTTSFAASKNGTTQDCSHCGAFVDVGDNIPFDSSDS